MPDTQSLFNALAHLDESARLRYYQHHQVPDDLRRAVEDLLRYDLQTHDGLRDRVAAEVEKWGQTRTAPRTRQCGSYRLVRELGQGGMGSVYLAERSDGEVEQKVAVKFLRSSTDAPAWIERFLRERQILASLRHSGITQLLDAGRTEDGQPYLVMEYVDGITIDRYVEGRPIQERLELFLQVCDAVAYAHRNLIVHRDIKPSNILVDAQGTAKLLDFGIAKILDTSTDQTRTRERMLTPEYASPEQVLGSAHSTSTDIYSLGAVLYKLLTGRSPHVIENASPDWIEAIICRSEPTRASQLNPELPRDLDFILSMALRKEPEARYRSVESLMEDVHAFFDRRPVRARGADPLYRLRRMLRRYWVPLTAATLAITGLTVGFITASRERAIAEQRFAQVRQAANRFININNQLSQIPGATKLRQSIISSSLDYLKALESGADRDPELAAEVGVAYSRVASVQGVQTGTPADQKTAEATLTRAARISDAALRRWPDHKGLNFASLLITDERIRLFAGQHRDSEALEQAAIAETIAQRMRVAPGGLQQSHQEPVAVSMANSALTHLNNHRTEDGIRVARLSADIARGTPRYGTILSILASGLRSRGDLEQALEVIREAKAIAERTGNEEVPRRLDLYGIYWREGIILGEEDAVSLGRSLEAAEAFARSMAVMEPLMKQDAADSGSRIRYASGARELGDVLAFREPARALKIYDLGIQRLHEMAANIKLQRDKVRLLTGSSYALRKLGRMQEARQRLDAGFALLAQTHDYPAVKIAPGGEAFVAIRALADWEEAVGHPPRALALYQELLQKMAASSEDPKLDLLYAQNYAAVYERLALLAPEPAASDYRSRRNDLWRFWAAKHPSSSYIRRQLEAAK